MTLAISNVFIYNNTSTKKDNLYVYLLLRGSDFHDRPGGTKSERAIIGKMQKTKISLIMNSNSKTRRPQK